MYEFFYVSAGHKLCLDFFMFQQDINHVWTFLWKQLYVFRGNVKKIIFIDNNILKENITDNTF